MLVYYNAWAMQGPWASELMLNPGFEWVSFNMMIDCWVTQEYTDLERVSPCSCPTVPQFPNPPHGYLSKSTLHLGSFSAEMIKFKRGSSVCLFFFFYARVNWISSVSCCVWIIDMSDVIFHFLNISMCAHVNSTVQPKIIWQCDGLDSYRSFSSLQTPAHTGLQSPVKESGRWWRWPFQPTKKYFGTVYLS